MGKIKQMSESLANQIAAGEVVERPASVVKELVENAIDANSTEILVEVVEAGIQQIRIVDNGEGMDEDDLALAFLPHATSKLYTVHELFQIQSLGFRGEALASIGSVAKVHVESTQQVTEKQPIGHYVLIEGSQLKDKGEAKARKGTSITVDSLFYNTPARLKHLNSVKTELRHILNFMQEIALSYPGIRFTLMSDKQKIFSSFGSGDLQQTIANVYQPAIARQLMAIEASDQDFKISGYISPPQLTRTSKYYLHWMINGRAIKSYTLNQILLKAYGRQLMIGRYPISVIQIELDPRLVDVNVHPTKQTVRISKEAELADLLTRTIALALQQINPVPSVEVEDLPTRSVPYVSPKAEELPFDFKYDKTETQSPTTEKQLANERSDHEPEGYVAEESPATSRRQALEAALKTNLQYNETGTANTQRQIKNSEMPPIVNQETQVSEPSTNDGGAVKADTATVAIDFASLRYVGQIHGTYLIAESQSGFYLIDQHAAQERTRYEDLMRYEPDISLQQQLLMPIVLTFSASEMTSVEQVMPSLERLGLYLDPFGPNSFQLESYPNWLLPDQIESMVQDLTTLLIGQPDLSIAQIKEESIIMQSCRGAIKANHYLDNQQAVHLIRSLEHVEDPYHCPHGRPVFIEFKDKTLEKLFKRIQDPHERGY